MGQKRLDYEIICFCGSYILGLIRKSIFELCGLKVTQVCEGDNDVVCETVFRITNNNQWWMLECGAE